MSVYKLKPESSQSILENYEDIIILTDGKFGDQTYIFIPSDIYQSIKKDLSSKLLGVYNETFPGDLSGAEVKKMYERVNYKPEVQKGDEGFLEGFGNVLFYVDSLFDGGFSIIPVNINLFKPILVTDKSKFTLAEKQTDKKLIYTWNCDIAIDCDMFPNISDHPFALELFRNNLVTITQNIYSIFNQVKVHLLNPCDLAILAGRSIGLEPFSGKKANILSDHPGANIRVNPKHNYTVTKLNKIERGLEVSASIHKEKLIEIYRYLSVSGHISNSETYQLLNNMYFVGEKMLDINIPYNPLDMGEED